MPEGYLIRSYTPKDPALKPYENLILATWLKAQRYGNDWFQDIEPAAYYSTQKQVIAAILSRPDTLVRLAVLPDDEDVALGWSVVENSILHFVFVKGDIQARRHGIGRALVPPGIDTFSHITKIGRAIWKAKAPNLKFNPFR